MTTMRTESRAELVRYVPALGVLVTWVVLMPLYGGYFPRHWLPAGLIFVALLVLAVAAGGRALPAAAPVRHSLLAFAAFVAWNFLSILWAVAPGKAWDASSLLLVYLLSAWILALTPWRAGAATLLLGGFSLAAAVTCFSELVAVLDDAVLTSRFDGYRWQEPLGYPNTTAAFALMGAIPALIVATRPGLPVLATALAQGLATFLAAYALLPLSRGSVLGVLLAAVVLFGAVPWRWRLAAHGAALAAGVLAVHGPIVDVYTLAEEPGRATDALRAARDALLLALAAGAALGAVLSLAQRRLRLGVRGIRAARIAGVTAWTLVALGLGGAAVANSTEIEDALREQWHSLRDPGTDYGGRALDAAAGAERFASLDPLQRYDYWRVALDGFRARPLGGMGAGGFEHRYAIDHRYEKVARYPHNLAMKTLGDTGVIGAVLLLAFAVLAGRGLLLGLRGAPAPVRMVVAAALGVACYFLAHGQFDWLEVYPVLAGPALGFLFVALALGHPGPPAPPRPHRRRAALVAAGAVAAVVALAPPYLAVRYVDRATDAARTAPAQAFRDLDRAAKVNPLGIDALLQRGALGLETGRLDVAGDSFARANAREPTYLAHFGLALVAAAGGDRARAVAELVRAKRLNRGSLALAAASASVLVDDLDPVRMFRAAQDTGLHRVRPVS